MNTVLFQPEPPESDPRLQEAAQSLLQGELVAFPTETVYGLGANALDVQAVQRIFEAKGRPSDNPLIVHVASPSDVERLVREITPVARRLMQSFWPGPLTLVMPRSSAVPDAVTAGLDTVAVRMPIHPTALSLIRLAGVPVAAPSANLSGRPSPTLAEHVLQDMGGRIPWIVDGGPCTVGLESTVLDVTVDPPMILRPGGVTKELLEVVLGTVQEDPALGAASVERPKSPGQKYRHYAPKADLTVYVGKQEAVEAAIREAVLADTEAGRSCGILCTDETGAHYAGLAAVRLTAGLGADLRHYASGIFRALRRFDETDVVRIHAEGCVEDGIGRAVMNRLRKAAGGRIRHV